MEKQTVIHEIELETKKVIRFRKAEISDYEMATQLASAQVQGDSPALLAMKMQKELMKLLIIEIDGKKLDSVDKEKIGTLLEAEEYMAANEFVGTLMGKSKIVRKGIVNVSGGKSPG